MSYIGNSPKELNGDDFKALEKNGAVYLQGVRQLIPDDWPEKRIMLEKITECLLWLRLGWENERRIKDNPEVSMKITPIQKDSSNEEKESN